MTPLSATRMRRAGRRWVTTGSTGATWRRPSRCETLHGFHGTVEGGVKPLRSEIAGPALGLPWPASGGTSRARAKARFITGRKVRLFLYYVKRNLLVFRRRHGALAGAANRGPLGALGRRAGEASRPEAAIHQQHLGRPGPRPGETIINPPNLPPCCACRNTIKNLRKPGWVNWAKE